MDFYYCVLFSTCSRVGAKIRVRIRFSVWLVSGYAHVFVLLSVVIVTRPKTFLFSLRGDDILPEFTNYYSNVFKPTTKNSDDKFR